MMSTHFYPAVSSGEPRYKADEFGNTTYEKPQQLSFLDRLLNLRETHKPVQDDE
jgi:hypothetical protein